MLVVTTSVDSVETMIIDLEQELTDLPCSTAEVPPERKADSAVLEPTQLPQITHSVDLPLLERMSEKELPAWAVFVETAAQNHQASEETKILEEVALAEPPQVVIPDSEDLLLPERKVNLLDVETVEVLKAVAVVEPLQEPAAVLVVPVALAVAPGSELSEPLYRQLINKFNNLIKLQ